MEKIPTGVIAAAGKGTRAYPRTSFIPKPLFEIEGKTILHRNVELLMKTFGVSKIYILVGHLREMVIQEIESIRPLYPELNLEIAPWTEKGLAADIASLSEKISTPFMTILGDEFYFKTNHEKFIQTYEKYPQLSASIGIVETSLLSKIRKNYSVELDGEKIFNLVEKPENPPNQFLGLGSYLFTPEYFDFFQRTPPSPKSGIIEITDVIDKMAKESKGGVYSTFLECRYFNINSMQDYHHAVYEVRHDSFSNFKISLVVPTKDNERSISEVLVDFKNLVYEVIVVDQNSKDSTVVLAEQENAKIFKISQEMRSQEFGLQIKKGIENASGDIIVVVSPDGSFRSKDFPKLLEYMKDSDMVIGTRTTRQMIEQGSNLNPIYRLMNLIMGKLIEVFWWGQEPRFTDADCQFFSIWKESYKKISPNLKSNDGKIIVEFMIEIVRSHLRCIEIPVSYFKSVESQNISVRKMFREQWEIFKLILKKKLSIGEENA